MRLENLVPAPLKVATRAPPPPGKALSPALLWVSQKVARHHRFILALSGSESDAGGVFIIFKRVKYADVQEDDTTRQD